MSTPRERGGTWYTIPGDEDCEHEPLVRLGADTGSNEYYQCEACETVLIKEGQVDHREIREQHLREREGSDDPLSKALNLDGLMGSGGERSPGMYGSSSSSSSIAVRIRKISRRILRR